MTSEPVTHISLIIAAATLVMAHAPPAPAAELTVAGVDAMRAEVEQHGLAAFLTAAAASNWQAPVIPSAWSVAHVVPAEQRPVAEAARTFGRALLDAIDANVPAVSTETGAALRARAVVLIDVAYWVGATEGFGNQLLAGRARDVAVVGLARLAVDETVPTTDIRPLLERTTAPFDSAATRGRILNAEAGAAIFPTAPTATDAQLEETWGIGVTRNRVTRQAARPTPSTTRGPAGQWTDDMYADLRQGLREAGVDPDQPNPHAAFFEDDLLICPPPRTTKQCWDYKWHEVLTMKWWGESRDAVASLLQFRETVGAFPVAPAARLYTFVPEQHDAFAQAWRPHIGSAPYNLGYDIWPDYDRIRRGEFVDVDSGKVRLWAAKNAPRATPSP